MLTNIKKISNNPKVLIQMCRIEKYKQWIKEIRKG